MILGMDSIQRPRKSIAVGASRRRLVAATVAAAVLAAGGCASDQSGGESPDAGPTASPESDVVPVVASADLAVGTNRFLLGLIDGQQDAPIRSPETTLRVGFLPPGSDTIETVTEMRFVWSQEPVQGLWVGEAEFSKPGEWRAAIQLQGGEYEGTVGTKFTVAAEPATPEIGTRPPPVVTPTAGKGTDLADISTDPKPVPGFYELSIADALRADRPAVIVFATPKFCASQVCGPTLSIVKDAIESFATVNVVHVEPYDLAKAPDDLEPVPAVRKWRLPSEPWVFVTDASGRLTSKFEGAVSADELTKALRDAAA